MSIEALRTLHRLPFVTSEDTAARVRAEFLPSDGGLDVEAAAQPDAHDVDVVELLFRLGLATAASIPAHRHPAAPLWAIARYVDLFAEHDDLRLDEWAQRTERHHRRAVLSEDLGVGITAYLAARNSPASLLLDVDAWNPEYGGGERWTVGSQRPDYVSMNELSKTMTVWESKGRTGAANSSGVTKTLAGAARQTLSLAGCGHYAVEERFVSTAVLTMEAISFHALRVLPPAAKANAGRSPRIGPRSDGDAVSQDELSVLGRFAGLSNGPQSSEQVQSFEFQGDTFDGLVIQVPTLGGLVSISVGVEASIRTELGRPPAQRGEISAQVSGRRSPVLKRTPVGERDDSVGISDQVVALRVDRL